MSVSIAISKNGKILAAFAIICTAIVGLVNELTKDKIYAQQQRQLLKNLNSIIEPTRYNNDLAIDCVKITAPLLGTNEIQTAYLARKNNLPIAAALTAIAPDGYNGTIELLIAVNIDGSISGVRSLKHQETPGLGDKIELRKSQWITSFSGKTLDSDTDSRWAVAKDGGMFDQFTGATITPRAVIKAVKNTAIYFKNNQQFLFTQSNACQLTTETEKIQSTDLNKKANDETK